VPGIQHPYLWGLALHLDDDRDLIPSAAVAALRAGQSASTHRLVIFFVEKTFKWLEVETLLDFDEYRDEMAKEPVVGLELAM